MNLCALSLVLGVLSALLIQFAFGRLYKWLISGKRATLPPVPYSTPAYPELIRKLMADPTVPEASVETCEWLNDLLTKILEDMIGRKALEAKVTDGINKSIKLLAEKHKFANEITIKDMQLGDGRIRVEHAHLTVPKTVDDDVVVVLDFHYDGSKDPAYLVIESTYLLSVKLRAGVKTFGGRLELRITRNAQIRISFVETPHLDLLFKAKVARVKTPKSVVRLIKQRLMEVIRFRLVSPKFVKVQLGPENVDSVVHITVLSASNLPEQCNACFTIQCCTSAALGEQPFTSEVISNCENPEFNLSYVFSDILESSLIVVEIYDKKVSGTSESLGYVNIPLASLPKNTLIRDSYPLQKRDPSQSTIDMSKPTSNRRVVLEFLVEAAPPETDQSEEKPVEPDSKERELKEKEREKLARQLEKERERERLEKERENAVATKITMAAAEVSHLRSISLPPLNIDNGSNGGWKANKASPLPQRRGGALRLDSPRPATPPSVSSPSVHGKPNLALDMLSYMMPLQLVYAQLNEEIIVPSVVKYDYFPLWALAIMHKESRSIDGLLVELTDRYMTLNDELERLAAAGSIKLLRKKLVALRDEISKLTTLLIDAGWQPAALSEAQTMLVTHVIPSPDSKYYDQITNISHDFAITSFQQPLFCQVCWTFMWGLDRQGHQCNICNFRAHAHCLANAPKSCPGAALMTTTQRAQSTSDVLLRRETASISGTSLVKRSASTAFSK